jgi:glutamate dehydrogenase (NADP+)
MKTDINDFMESLKARTPGEREFHQAVQEVVESIWDVYKQNPRYQKAKILERMVEPRGLSCSVCLGLMIGEKFR